MSSRPRTYLILDILMISALIGMLVYVFFGHRLNFSTKKLSISPISLPQQAAFAQVSTDSFSDVPVIGTWLWKDVTEMSDEDMDRALEFAKANKINTIYLTIDHYIELFELKNAEEKAQKINEYESRTKTFIDKASGNNIKVEGLIGNKEWSNYSLQYIPATLLNFVGEYNSKNPNSKFSGVQIDIEYYNKANFNGSKSDSLNFLLLLSNLIKTTNTIRDTPYNDNLTFGVALPPWLDSSKSWASSITWQGKQDNMMEHIFNLLNSTTNVYVVLLAYRNYAIGSNGTLSLAENEVKTASDRFNNVKILVGQETAEGDGASTSFIGKPKFELIREVNKVILAFNNYSAFNGISIHHLYSFMNLK